MYPHTELEKELKKTHYLNDKTKQLERVRTLLKVDNRTETISLSDKERIFNYCAENNLKVSDVDNDRMFYNTSVNTAYVRELEIEVYAQQIFKKAEELKTNSDVYKSICYLIDEQYKYHKELFESKKHDVFYSNEYNQLIYELIQDEINILSNIEYEPINDTIHKNLKKSITWESKKTSIGTLFGMFHKEGIIKGSKADIVRALTSMFSNLRSSTLEDNMKLTYKEKEDKYTYDVDTENMAQSYINYLKNK